MTPWKTFRDTIVILTCLYVAWHISTLHPFKDERGAASKHAIDQAFSEMGK